MYMCYSRFLAICEPNVKWHEKSDLTRLSLLPTQACGQLVKDVYSCWTVDFYEKDSGRIFYNSLNNVTYAHWSALSQWLSSLHEQRATVAHISLQDGPCQHKRLSGQERSYTEPLQRGNGQVGTNDSENV